MRYLVCVALLVGMFAIGSVPGASADVPTSVTIQGRLADSTGNALQAGTWSFTFRIYDLEVGGSEIWPGGLGETQSVEVDGSGLWNAAVGALIPLPDSVFRDTERWLEVTVDNGQDPPETLSRLRLLASPYAFRLASIDRARGGELATDLQVPGVSIGDSAQSGNLSINLEGTGTPAISGGAFGTFGGSLQLFDEGGAVTHALEADGAGEGGFLGVYGTAGATSGFVVDGNVAGTGDPIVQIFGSASSTFFDTRNAGDPAVLLPSDAVSAGEVLDEPGIAHAFEAAPDGDLVFITTDTQADDTLSITAPADGFIVLQATGYWLLQHSFGGSSSFLRASIASDATVADLDNLAWVQLPPGAPTGDYVTTFAITRVVQVTAGSYTFYLNGSRGTSAGSASYMRRSHLLGVYYPTAYGTVVATVAPNVERQPDVDRGAATAAAGPVSVRVTAPEHQAKVDSELTLLRSELEALREKVQKLEHPEGR